MVLLGRELPKRPASEVAHMSFTNGVSMQFVRWYDPYKGSLWTEMAANAGPARRKCVPSCTTFERQDETVGQERKDHHERASEGCNGKWDQH